MKLLVFNLRTDADDGVLGFTTDWLNALADRCEAVFVVSTEVGAVRVRSNVQVFGIGKEEGAGKLGRFLNLYRITSSILRHKRVDACFAHMNYLFPLRTSPLLKLSGVPIMTWYAHGSTPPLLYPATLISDRMVSSSPSGFRLKTRKLRIIGQGVDTDRFVPVTHHAPDGPIRVLTLGRISRIKRLEVVIDAMAQLRELAPHLDLRCELVGDPLTDDGRAYKRELETRITERGLQDRVRLISGVPFHRAHQVIAEADVFVNSGDTDSVDKTVLEALSCGVPVLTSNAAFTQILPPPMHALSLVPKNDFGALALGIQQICELTPEERFHHTAMGRQMVVQQHSLGSLADKIMAELRELVGSARHHITGGQINARQD